VSTKRITDELVQQLANDPRARTGLNDKARRVLGLRLAEPASARSDKIELVKSKASQARPTGCAG
jgi:hypothetical protein